MKIAEIRNTYGADNAIDLTGGLTPAIQISKVAGGSWIDAFLLTDNMMLTAASGYRGGDILVGNIDIKAQVADGVASQFRIGDDCKADGDSLILADVQFGIRIWFI